MVALYVKGGKRILGKNRLSDPAHMKHDAYPEICGRHCEQHICIQAEKRGERLRGGTLYVVGVKRDRQMLNTKPCPRCQKVLAGHGVRSVVYLEDGCVTKMVA